jgi:hypothetical protein
MTSAATGLEFAYLSGHYLVDGRCDRASKLGRSGDRWIARDIAVSEAPLSEPQGDDPLLRGFSTSVGDVMRGLDFAEPTVWQIADLMLRRQSDLGGSALLPLAYREGEKRPKDRWLVLVRGLFDEQALAGAGLEVVDERLMLLALGRLDADFSRVLIASGLQKRLEQDAGADLGSIVLPWALPPQPVELLEFARLAHEEPVRDCAFSPNGRLLATVSDDGLARLWSRDGSGEPVVLRGHTGSVRRCAFAPGGELLATAGADATVRLSNEEKQLRLALGQVLRYRHLLQSSDPDVRGFIAIENAPRDPSWVDFCASVSVSLVCPRTSPTDCAT